jgi:hypothetical protein
MDDLHLVICQAFEHRREEVSVLLSVGVGTPKGAAVMEDVVGRHSVGRARVSDRPPEEMEV